MAPDLKRLQAKERELLDAIKKAKRDGELAGAAYSAAAKKLHNLPEFADSREYEKYQNALSTEIAKEGAASKLESKLFSELFRVQADLKQAEQDERDDTATMEKELDRLRDEKAKTSDEIAEVEEKIAYHKESIEIDKTEVWKDDPRDSIPLNPGRLRNAKRELHELRIKDYDLTKRIAKQMDFIKRKGGRYL